MQTAAMSSVLHFLALEMRTNVRYNNGKISNEGSLRKWNRINPHILTLPST